MKFDMKLKWTPRDVELKMAKAPELVQEELQKGLTILRDITAAGAVKSAPKDRYKLARTIPAGASQSLTRTVKNKAIIGTKYYTASWFEWGLRPFWPPQEPIAEWVRRKGLAHGQEAESVAFFIRRKIAERGIKRRRFLGGGLAEAMKKAQYVMNQTAERILERLGLS